MGRGSFGKIELFAAARAQTRELAVPKDSSPGGRDEEPVAVQELAKEDRVMFACLFMNGWKFTARASVRLGCATAAVVLGACDPQASPLFQGEALFTLHGSVSIAEDHTEGELSPALAFVNKDAGKIELVDVEVRGTFPADFRIEVFAPPSEHAFMQLRDYGAHEPRLALGYITAVIMLL